MKSWLDGAAQFLTSARLGCGFKVRRGITERYMAAWGVRLGMLSLDEARPFLTPAVLAEVDAEVRA